MTQLANFPRTEWETRSAEDLGFDAAKLEKAGERLSEKAGADAKYRVVVARSGYIVREWCQGLKAEDRVHQASAAKSTLSSMLGVAIGEGKIPSADAFVSEYYPEMLEVPEGSGPKPERANKPEDAQITFRQLITNTSGYLKPGELPGKVYHYQTYGMNILAHALGKIYGVYDLNDPEAARVGELYRAKVCDPIGADWNWSLGNFKLWPQAKLEIFGYATGLQMTARDQARLGWLWLNRGNWNGNQVVPADYTKQAVVTAPDILENCPEDQWCYGHGFWTNDHGKLWPSLPRDSFAASGAGKQLVWVCPSLDLVVAESPGIYEKHVEEDEGAVRWIVDAVRE